MQKKVALFVFGIDDSIQNNGDELCKNITSLINSSELNPDTIVLVNNASNTKVKYSLGKINSGIKVIDFNLRSAGFYSAENLIVLNTCNGEKQYLSGDNIDFIISPEEYYVYLVGADIKGMMPYAARDLKAAGYSLSVVTDRCNFYTKMSEERLKRFKIRTISHTGIGYHSKNINKKK